MFLTCVELTCERRFSWEAKLFNLAVVTGASGHLGANFVRRLVADERPVRVVLLPDDPAPALAGLDIERVPGDVLDEQSLR